MPIAHCTNHLGRVWSNYQGAAQRFYASSSIAHLSDRYFLFGAHQLRAEAAFGVHQLPSYGACPRACQGVSGTSL
jgi:hypothetical protein